MCWKEFTGDTVDADHSAVNHMLRSSSTDNSSARSQPSDQSTFQENISYPDLRLLSILTDN